MSRSRFGCSQARCAVLGVTFFCGPAAAVKLGRDGNPQAMAVAGGLMPRAVLSIYCRP